MAEHVGRDAVVPLRTRLGNEGNAGRDLHHLGQAFVRRLEIDATVAIQRVHRRRFHEAVGQPGGMCQQVAKIYVALGRHRIQLAAHAAHEHSHVLEARQEPRDRIVELEMSLLVQHHDRRRCQRLGHRIETEDRVRRHPRRAPDVGQAAHIEMHQLAAARHRGDQPGEPAVIDEAPRPRIHTRKPLRRKADVLGFCVHHHLLSPRLR